MNDLVDQMFPPVHVQAVPEYTDFNFWRSTESFAEFELPDLSPPSPALSARSDTSGRLSVFRNLTGSLRGSRASTPVPSDAGGAGGGKHSRHQSTSSGPSSPLFGPVLTSDSELSEEDETASASDAGNPHSPAVENERRRARASSMPGSLPDTDFFTDRFDELDLDATGSEDGGRAGSEGAADNDDEGEGDVDEEDPDLFDDDLLATGEMGSVPF
jgi:phosphatidate phosphatase LPIN